MNTRTILVVDDIPLMRTMLVKYIKSLGLKILNEAIGVNGLEILEAANGADALDLLHDSEVDLMFLDLMMPEMDGISFLKTKLQDESIQSIPVIVCSALGEKETVAEAESLGAVGFIVKPFTMKSVEQKFRDALAILQD